MASENSSICHKPNVCDNSKLSRNVFSYQWKVETFSEFFKRQYEIPSQEFIPNPADGSAWKLVLFTKHIYPEGSHLAVRLVKLSNDGIPHGVKYTISLVNDNSRNYVQTREKIFYRFLDFDEFVIINYDELFKEKLLQYPHQPDLTILCEMDMIVVENSPRDSVDSTLLSAKCCEIESLARNPIKTTVPLVKSHKVENLPRGQVETTVPSEKCYKVENIFRDPIEPPLRLGECHSNNLSFPSSNMNQDVNTEYTKKTNNLHYSSNNLSDDELTSFTSHQNEESLNALSDDFEVLYLKKKCADMTVFVEGKAINAHKAILAARSDFFGTANRDDICITGMRSTVMEAVLYYMYTGKTQQLTVDLALDMLRAAKRFHLHPLEKLTKDFLKSNIELENVLEVLELADELYLDDLKHICLKFATCNRFELEQTEKWHVVVKKNPRVAGQVLLAIGSVETPSTVMAFNISHYDK